MQMKRKNVENYFNNNRGITLIALVITIIVMLILAGVTISLTLGENGIFRVAQKATKNYIEAEEEELSNLQNYEEQINQYIESTLNTGVVHYNAIYKVASYNAETSEYTYTELKAGEKFPETVSNGDVYIYGDYEYRYNQYYEYDNSAWVDNTEQNGWGVTVLDRTKTSYREILTSINGKNITSLYKTFRFCKELIEAPTIPNGVTNMDYTFGGCHKLTKAPIIPSQIEKLQGTFYYCAKLEKAPTIPNSVKDMLATFSGCLSLKIIEDLPDNLENMESTFYNCSSLISVNGIPDTVTNMKTTFYGCTSLVSIDKIPNGVTDLLMTFKNCTSLKTVPAIHKGVTVLTHTFLGCTSLTNVIEINANPTSYTYCFGNVDFAAQGLTLTGDSEMLDELGATGLNYSSNT